MATGLVSLFIGVACAATDDVVFLKAEAGSRAPRKIIGRVLDYTGRELRIRPATGPERVVPSADVERVETAHTAEQTAADELFVDGDYKAALGQYRSVLDRDRESRGWIRREILAQMVWCQRALDQGDQAGETFLTLLSRDADTQYFSCIPLAWTGAQPTPALEQKARAWLTKRDQPAAQLLGASHLLATVARTAALEKLTTLSKHDDPRIAWLAQAQLWRTRAAKSTVEECDRWSAQIESSPEALRAGPYFVLGSALVAKEPEAAALAFMRLPILYPRERALSATALLAAGGCLEKIEQRAEAAIVYRELLNDYRAQPETAEAQRRLDGLTAQARPQ